MDLKEKVRDLKEQLKLIKSVPAPFFVSLAFCVFIVWSVVNWYYGKQVSDLEKDAWIKRSADRKTRDGYI